MRIIPSLRESLTRLLDSHSLFGGRERELTQLNTFVEQDQSGYLFVTARSGYGKTALLANWVRTFPRDNLQVCYHFMSRVYRKTTDEDFGLRNLCQQLTAYHDLRGTLPDNTSELRALYPYLLAIPNKGRKVVVVLDGLDEASDWIGPELFPQELPAGVFVIFSAREMAERNWLESLELSPRDVEVLTLTTLDIAGIAHLLGAAGDAATKWANDEAFVKMVHSKSEGDPFYVRYLVEDIRDGQIMSLAQLENQPSKLKGYLDKWWDEVSQGVSETAVSELIGYLLVAKGRLSRDDLTDISQTDALSGAVFERTIKQLQRYVIGDEKDGYTFCHPRFRDYVASERIKEAEQQPFRQRLLDYCSRWQEHKSEYVLAHYTSHLAEAGRTKDLLELLNPEWLRAKWNCFGSYSALIEDLNVAAAACLKQEQPAFDKVAALAAARQTARELMLDFPVPLLIAWVRLGEIKRVLELLKALGSVKGRAVEALTAVAGEVLSRRGAKIPDDRFDAGKVASDLLADALGMLQLVRDSKGQLEALEEITDLLKADKGLSATERAPLLDQARAFASSVTEPALRASALGLVAEALVTDESRWEQARDLIAQARSWMEKISFAPDRLIATAYLLPALNSVQPDAVLAAVQTCVQSGDPLQSSSLDKNPLRTILKKWAPNEVRNGKEAAPILHELAEFCLKQDEGFIAGRMAVTLCEIGDGAAAVRLIEGVWEKTPLEGARAVIEAAETLARISPERTSEWLEQAHEFVDYSHHSFSINRELYAGRLAISLAAIGKWSPAIDLLQTVNSERVYPLCECLALAGEAFANNPAEMQSTVQRLIELSPDGEAEAQAKVYAMAAQEMVPCDFALARKHLNHAAGLCLANLPEGDTDALRELLAIACHEAGDYEGANNAIEPMKWVVNAVKTYATLIKSTPPEKAETLKQYTEMILATLNSRLNNPLFHEAVTEALNAAQHLAEKQAGMSPADRDQIGALNARLCDFVLDVLPNIGGYDQIIQGFATEAATRFLIDPPTGIERFDRLIGRVGQLLTNGADMGAHTVTDIFRRLGVVASKNPTEALLLLKEATSLARFFPSLEDQLNLESAYAAAMAPMDTNRAIALLRKQFPIIVELGEQPPPAPHLVRMMSEFVGRLMGPRYLQARAAQTVGAAIISIAPYNSEQAAGLMSDLLVTIRKIPSPPDLAQALIEFAGNYSRVPTDVHDDLSSVFTEALDEIRNLPTDLSEEVLSKTIKALCATEKIEDARRAAELLTDSEAKELAQSDIDIATERMQSGVLSPLESAFTQTHDAALAYAIVHSIRREAGEKVLLSDFAAAFANDSIAVTRERLISEFIRAMILPAHAVGGNELVASFIKSIENFDGTFLKAASLIAAPQ